MTFFLSFNQFFFTTDATAYYLIFVYSVQIVCTITRIEAKAINLNIISSQCRATPATPGPRAPAPPAPFSGVAALPAPLAIASLHSLCGILAS